MAKRVVLVLAILLVIFSTKQFVGETQTLPSTEVSKEAVSTESEVAAVSKVIDGDTIELVDGRRVRYVGIDAPEVNECFASEAREENVRLLDKKMVRLVKDVTDTDKYGRILRYVYLPAQAGIGDELVNDHLVRQGYVRVMGIPPDTMYYAQFKQAQEEAQNNNRGLWSVCK